MHRAKGLLVWEGSRDSYPVFVSLRLEKRKKMIQSILRSVSGLLRLVLSPFTLVSHQCFSLIFITYSLIALASELRPHVLK